MLPNDLKASVARQRDLAQLRDKLVGVRAQQTSRHPEVMALERQIAEHERELSALDSRIASMRLVEEELRSLEAAENLAREEYVSLKRELQRAELGGSLLDAQPGDRMSVLNPAELPAHSVGARWRYLLLGLLASVLLALGCGVALELLQPVVLSADDLFEITGQPALGWVARIR
jgi:succinoglycan biosynthesis transport protein ExoP